MLLFNTSWAQDAPPEMFKFQALITKPNGNPVSDKVVGVEIAIYQSAINGTLVYSEEFTPTTNKIGIINLEIGNGTPTTLELFSDIQWESGTFFLQLSADIKGGTNYTSMGASQLLSVPYALYAKTAKTAGHEDTSSQSSVNNTGGSVIQSITLDTYGHVTGLITLDLDSRYYTESEIDQGFVSIGSPTQGHDNFYYADKDGDGFGAKWNMVNVNETPPEGYVDNSDDCNDLDESINPNATEIPDDDIDQNCDGIELYLDQDGDGYTSDVDCDDNDNTVYPGVAEVCDGKDNNCDGVIDEGCDTDDDGFTVADGDCDDTNSYIYPGASDGGDACDGIDNDCDGMIDEDVIFSSDEDNCGECGVQCPLDWNCVAGECVEPDSDYDGYSVWDGDCNDNDNTIYPGATEICGDGIDNDCDDVVDESCQNVGSDGNCLTGYGDCDGIASNGCETDLTNDVDNCGACDNTCSISHGTTISCSDGECEIICDDGWADCDGGPSNGCETDISSNENSCGACGEACPPGYICVGGSCEPNTNTDNDEDGYTIAQGDCEDNNPDVNPGADEVCDGIDNNCDGEIDEDCNIDIYIAAVEPSQQDIFIGSTANIQVFTNVFGEEEINVSYTSGITGPSTLIIPQGDDSGIVEITAVSVGSETVTFSIGSSSETALINVLELIDADLDGSPVGLDCDDNDNTIYPGATEVCDDGIDNDCDGLIDASDCECNPLIGTSCDGTDSDSCDEGVFECDGQGNLICYDFTGDSVEVCNNGIDDDCDGQIDEDCVDTPQIGDFYQGGIVFFVDETGQHGLVCAVSDAPELLDWYEAFDFCNNYSLTGESVIYDDWYLPSRDELNQMDINKAAIVNGGGVFTTYSYWSSTEYYSYNAWVQSFSYGSQTYDDKINPANVRAVRAF